MILLYIPNAPGKLRGIVMEYMDIIVSYFTMPFAVALCFGPAIIVWWVGERKKNASADKK